MNNNLTEIIFVLDRSGSMEHLTLETIGGFNSLIEHQREQNPGELRVTCALFDDKYELLYDHVDVKNMERLTTSQYYARGCTALLDAVGRTIDNVGCRLAETPEENRPGNILFVITTDGYENASKDYTRKKVKQMIEHQQEKYNWKFLFLGADIDAVSEADSIGIRRSCAVTSSATGRGIHSSYKAVDAIASYCCMSMTEPGEATEEAFDMACCKAFEDVE